RCGPWRLRAGLPELPLRVGRAHHAPRAQPEEILRGDAVTPAPSLSGPSMGRDRPPSPEEAARGEGDPREPEGRGARVLHVVRSLEIGGVEAGVLNLLPGLERAGLRQAICCLEGAGPWAGRVPGSVPIRACGDSRPGLRLAPLWRAAGFMRAFRPDVVHARNCGAWVDGAAAWLLAGRPGRLAFSIHGLDWVGGIPRRRVLAYRLLAR